MAREFGVSESRQRAALPRCCRDPRRLQEADSSAACRLEGLVGMLGGLGGEVCWTRCWRPANERESWQ